MASYERTPRGETSVAAKLTTAEVVDIRKLHSSGKYVAAELARLFNVSRETIRLVVTRQTWKHVP